MPSLRTVCGVVLVLGMAACASDSADDDDVGVADSVLAPPAITSLSPTAGLQGSSVLVVGRNFTSGASVAFNGRSAAFTFTDAMHLRATVPVGATTGPITVTTPAGIATSTVFHVRVAI